MKLKNLSRLTALLLALMMLLSSVAAAEIYGLDYTSSDFDQLVHAVQRQNEAYCTDPLCAYGWTAINEYAIEDRYGYFMGLGLSADELDKMLLHLINHSGSFPEEMCLNCYIQDRTLYPYGSNRHREDCPWYGSALDTTLTTNGQVVQVSVTGDGYTLPTDVKLQADIVSLDEIKAVVPYETITDTDDTTYQYHPLDGITSRYVALDLSLEQKGVKYQPVNDGKEVTVTVNAAALQLNPGDHFMVYHVHSDDNVNWTGEWLNVEPATEQNTATFTMSKFSYVLVFSSGVEITGVGKYYPAEQDATAGNGQISTFGAYFDMDGYLHFLFAVKQYKAFVGIKIDDGTVEKEITNLTTTHIGSVSYVELQNSNKETVGIFESESPVDLYDVKLNELVTLSGTFEISTAWKQGDYEGNSFSLKDVPVSLSLHYSIEKLVSTDGGLTFVDSAQVKADDEVIYKVEVTNFVDSATTLSATVTDTLPEGMVALAYGQSMDSDSMQKLDPPASRLELGSFIDLKRGESVTYYVRAKVNTGTVGEYINTASVSGTGVPKLDATATVFIPDPEKGTIVLSKVLENANVADMTVNTAPFKFEIKRANGGKVRGSDETITVTLPHNGQMYITLTDLIVGDDYIITETSCPASIGGSDYKGKDKDDTAASTPTEAATTMHADRITQNGVQLVKESTTNVTVTNEYIYSDRELVIEKSFEGVDPALMENYQFTFEVYYPNTSEPVIVNLPYQGSWKVALRDVIAGPYTIKEHDPSANVPANHKYISTKWTGGTTGLESTAVVGTGSTTITCTNVYQAQNSTLTITKAGDTVDPNDSFIFTVTGEGVDMKVVIKGTGSVTIADLPLGTYTVTEDLAWSWKYTLSGENGQSVTVDADGGMVTFTNTKTEKWLNSEYSVHNDFSQNSTPTTTR